MLCRWWIINVIVNTVMSMVDRQRYRQQSYVNGGSSAGDHRSSVSAQDVGESRVMDSRDVIPGTMSN